LALGHRWTSSRLGSRNRPPNRRRRHTSSVAVAAACVASRRRRRDSRSLPGVLHRDRRESRPRVGGQRRFVRCVLRESVEVSILAVRRLTCSSRAHCANTGALNRRERSLRAGSELRILVEASRAQRSSIDGSSSASMGRSSALDSKYLPGQPDLLIRAT
jgi:hypothetical protein